MGSIKLPPGSVDHPLRNKLANESTAAGDPGEECDRRCAEERATEREGQHKLNMILLSGTCFAHRVQFR